MARPSEQPSPGKSVVAKPALGLPVIVTTREKIDGQSEHAGIITFVHSDELVNVTIFPASSQPYPIPAIYHAKRPTAGLPNWRWPPSRS